MHRPLIAFAAAALTAVALSATPAYASPTAKVTPSTCPTGSLQGNVPGGVTVGTNDTCNIEGAVVGGNVTAGAGALLVIADNSTIDGNVTITDGNQTEVCGSTITGNFVATSTTGHGRVTAGYSPWNCAPISVGGHATISNYYQVDFNNNQVTGVLSCSGNAVVDALGNSASKAKGQCSQ